MSKKNNITTQARDDDERLISLSFAGLTDDLINYDRTILKIPDKLKISKVDDR